MPAVAYTNQEIRTFDKTALWRCGVLFLAGRWEVQGRHGGQNATIKYLWYYTVPTSGRGKQDPIPEYGIADRPARSTHISSGSLHENVY